VLHKIRSINRCPVQETEEGESLDRPSDAPSKRNFLHPFKILIAMQTYRGDCKFKTKIFKILKQTTLVCSYQTINSVKSIVL